MHIAVSADTIETEKATHAIASINGPAVVRYAREATPIIATFDTPYISLAWPMLSVIEEKRIILPLPLTQNSHPIIPQKEKILLL